MISRHCTKAKMNLINKTRRIGAKTLRCLNGFANNYRATGKLTNATWSMSLETCLSVIRKQPSYKIFNRGKSANVGNSIPVVIHDEIGKRFYIAGDGMDRIFLKYEQKGQVIKIIHTEVPKEFIGRGYGKLLAKEALDFVVQNDYQLRIRCGFVRAYANHHGSKYKKYMK